ncbi:hypothetical protein ZL54_22460 [Salmonella enterica subsp. enterica]|nr:hypothetical protein [Salmonella enterica subsp. enterica]EEJ7209101.1 hypothetical protein [Salmonella enterica subsp. enterica]
MKQPRKTDFFVDVPDIGNFRFARRSIHDEMQIQRYFSEYTGGCQPTAWYSTLAEFMSVLRALIVTAPEGWDIDTLDPLDEESYSQMSRVYEALREQEERFRGRSFEKSESQRQGNDERGGLLVSEDVPPVTA